MFCRCSGAGGLNDDSFHRGRVSSIGPSAGRLAAGTSACGSGADVLACSAASCGSTPAPAFGARAALPGFGERTTSFDPDARPSALASPSSRMSMPAFQKLRRGKSSIRTLPNIWHLYSRNLSRPVRISSAAAVEQARITFEPLLKCLKNCNRGSDRTHNYRSN